jgi:protein TonB
MFSDVLIESAGKDKKTGTWITALISAVLHLGIVGAIIVAGMYVKENPEVIEKPMSVFIIASAPPPPPPPLAGGAGSRPQVTRVETQERPRQELRQRTEIPRELPQVPDPPRNDDAGEPAGRTGGVKGGDPEGVVGGKEGGVRGGTPGGQTGGTAGGAGTGTGDTPVHVGGNVNAPVAVTRVEPLYTESARRARIQGFVIIQAVIDRQGNVTEARVLKPLPLGLDMAALEAVKRWKFRPGTLNGQPVPVYYNLTVNFQLQ